MTDKQSDVEQYALAVDVNSICYCRERNRVECKAHRRLVRFANDVVELAAKTADRRCREQDEAAKREKLPEDFGGDPQIAADIRALKCERI